MIVIVDYGMGNLGSIFNMIKKVGGVSKISSNKDEIQQATKIILPGVGAFDNAIKNLKKLDLVEVIKYKVLVEKVPILGICLGMQLLTKKSEEGILKGLSFVDACVKRFRFEKKDLKIPHMGWNTLELKKESNLFKGMEQQENRFYFVHSFAVHCNNKDDVLSTTFYGYDFVSSFEKNNIIGVQFHPEKSHRFGMQLLKNFIELY